MKEENRDDIVVMNSVADTTVCHEATQPRRLDVAYGKAILWWITEAEMWFADQAEM